MKKMFAVITIVLLVAAAAMATINLSGTVVQTHTQGGATVETDDTANVTGALNNFPAQTLQVRVDFGSMNGQAFQPSAKVPIIQLVVDYGNCKYQSSDGQFTGNIPAPTCNALKTKAKAYQDGLENLVISAGIAPGTQVAN
jgi:hypothetical protein